MVVSLLVKTALTATKKGATSKAIGASAKALSFKKIKVNLLSDVLQTMGKQDIKQVLTSMNVEGSKVQRILRSPTNMLNELGEEQSQQMFDAINKQQENVEDNGKIKVREFAYLSSSALAYGVFKAEQKGYGTLYLTFKSNLSMAYSYRNVERVLWNEMKQSSSAWTLFKARHSYFQGGI